MSHNDEWAFNVREHINRVYADRIGFIPDEEQRYPDRHTGTLVSGDLRNPTEERAVIIPKPVGADNAQRFRRWVALPPVHWENLTSRPRGWRYFILMIGLLPDGQPWWSRLYDEQLLAQSRDLSEQVSARGGSFYRFDPGLTAPALMLEWDSEKPGVLESPAVYQVNIGKQRIETREAADFVAALWDAASDVEQLAGALSVVGETMTVDVK